MSAQTDPFPKARSTAAVIRQRIEEGGERFWTYADFAQLPAAAVAKTLSRLDEEGFVRRTGKGIYYRPRSTVFGRSQVSESSAAEVSATHRLHPSGISAANILGFTTQNPGRTHYATTGPSAPAKLENSKVSTRRPQARERLSREEGAYLEFLRARGSLSEYAPAETVQMLIHLLKGNLSFENLARAALSEPPRVRAILGAIGEEAGQPPSALEPLRESLNTLSRFDFGHLRVLKHAKQWRAK